MKTIKVTAGVIVDKGKILITRRAPTEQHNGFWEFPGGKIEVGETPQVCLARELKEELNIVVSVGEFCTEVFHDYGNANIHLRAYYCRIIDGDIQTSVHDQFKWIGISELLKHDLLPADIPIAKKIIEDYHRSNLMGANLKK